MPHDIPRGEDIGAVATLAAAMSEDNIPGFLVAARVGLSATSLAGYFSYQKIGQPQYLNTPPDKTVQIMHTDCAGVCACEHETVRIHRNLAGGASAATVALAHVIENGQRRRFERGTVLRIVECESADIPNAEFYTGLQEPNDIVVFRPRSPHQFITEGNVPREFVIQDLDKQ